LVFIVILCCGIKNLFGGCVISCLYDLTCWSWSSNFYIIHGIYRFVKFINFTIPCRVSAPICMTWPADPGLLIFILSMVFIGLLSLFHAHYKWVQLYLLIVARLMSNTNSKQSLLKRNEANTAGIRDEVNSGMIQLVK
jgi:hypothetical protein